MTTARGSRSFKDHQRKLIQPTYYRPLTGPAFVKRAWGIKLEGNSDNTGTRNRRKSLFFMAKVKSGGHYCRVHARRGNQMIAP
jgi:hypothetical protein